MPGPDGHRHGRRAPGHARCSAPAPSTTSSRTRPDLPRRTAQARRRVGHAPPPGADATACSSRRWSRPATASSSPTCRAPSSTSTRPWSSMTGYSRAGAARPDAAACSRAASTAPEFYAELWRDHPGPRQLAGRADQPPQGRQPVPDVADDLAHRRRPGAADALRRHPARRDRTQAAGAAAVAGAEDAERRHAGGRRGPRVQQPAGGHQRLRLAGPARAGRRRRRCASSCSTSSTCPSGRRR